MQASVKFQAALSLSSCLLCVSCLTGIRGLKKDPKWVNAVVSQLYCGQSLGEVQLLTERRIENTTTQPDFGSFVVSSKFATIWFDFQSSKLVSVTTGRIDGLASIRTSPKTNLCTGELTFWVSLGWIVPLEGADVYLDGDLVEANASAGVVFSFSTGRHELRVVKEGFEPIVKIFHFGPEDMGHVWLDLTEPDVQLVNTQPES